MKPFIVDQTLLVLERGQLRIPTQEDDEVISRQMTNYRMVGQSKKSREPIYSDEDDHALDAMMLSILAFIEEKNEILETMFTVQVAKEIKQVHIKYSDPLTKIAEGDKNNVSDNRFVPRQKKQIGSLGLGRRGSKRRSYTSRRGF